MQGKKTTKRFNPVLFLPVCLFGTRFISGLIFRPRDESEQGSEHKFDQAGAQEAQEAVEDTEEEIVAADDLEEEEEKGVVVEEETDDKEALKEMCVKEEEEEEVVMVDEEEDVEESGKVVEDDVVTNFATWETLSLPSVDREDISTAAALPGSAAMAMEACSRAVLLNQWLKGLAFCQAPRFADRFPVEPAAPVWGGVATPRKSVDLEREMERTNCFTNPVYFNLTPRAATPRTATPRSMTPRSATPRAVLPGSLLGGMSQRRRGASRAAPKAPPKVEPFVLKKQQTLGGITSRSDGARDDEADPKSQVKFGLSSISVLATPRQACAPNQHGFVTPTTAQAWVRERARTGLGFSAYFDGAKAGLMAHYLEGPRDSAEDLRIPASRLGVAGRS